MTVKDLIDMICDEEECSQASIAKRIGVSRQNLARSLERNNGMNMSIETFVRWADRLGFQIVLYSERTEDEYVFDGEDDSFYFDYGK